MGQRKNPSPRQESNPRPPKHRAGGLSTELREPLENKVICGRRSAYCQGLHCRSHRGDVTKTGNRQRGNGTLGALSLFDQISRFEISGIPCDEWNSIFRFVGLTRPRSSGFKFRAKIRNQTGAVLPLFTCFGLLDRLRWSWNKRCIRWGWQYNFYHNNLQGIRDYIKGMIPLYFPDEFKSRFRMTSELFTRAVLLTFHVAHMYFRTTH